MWPHCGIHSVSLYDICTGNKHHLIQVGLLSISTSRQATPIYIDSALPSPRAVIVKIAARYIYHQFLWIAFLIDLCFYSGNILLPRVIDADTFGVSMECHSKGLIAVQPIMFVSFDIDYISMITLYSAYPCISTHRYYVHLAMHGQIDGPMD